MELKIGTAELTRALARVQGIVEKKTTMPILVNVLLETQGKGELRVSATNLEIGLSGVYPAEVKTAGSLTLGGRALFEIVRSLPGPSVHLHQSANHWMEIQSGKVKFKLVGMAAENFPKVPRFEDVALVPIEAKLLKEMLDKTLYSVSTDETRYNLTGVYFEPLPGDQLRLVSTDGHRLSIIERQLASPLGIKRGVIIPRKGMQEIRRLLDDGEGDAKLGFVENSAILQRGEVVLSVQLLEGQFPDYQQVIPSGFTRRVRVRREAFLQSLKRMALLAPDKAQGVKIELAEGVMTLAANNPDLGEAREELEVELEGDPVKIGFNYRYILDTLTVLSDEVVDFRLSDALSPGLLTGADSPHYRAIVMPMRL